jgi:hypothetical protein
MTTDSHLKGALMGALARTAACRFAWILMGAIACLAGSAAEARGGTYEVMTCDHAPGGVNNSWVAQPGEKMWTGQHCPTAGGEAAGLFAGSGVNVGTIAPFAHSQQGFDAPAGTSIVHLSARYMFRRFDPYWRLGVFAGTQLLHGCEPATQESGCNFKTSTDSTWGWTPGQVQRVSVITACGSGSGCRSDAAAPSGDRAGVRLYAATVRVHDDSAPAIWDTGSGPLTSGVWQRGTQLVGFAGSDNVGFRRTRLWVDGTLLRDDARDCDFTQRRPCSDITFGAYGVNTAGLADGNHEVRVEGVDAAGNAASYTAPFRSDNKAPDEAQDVRLEGGEGWRQANRFKLTWRNPPSASPISVVHYELCNMVTGVCSVGGRSGDGISSIADLSVPQPGHYTVRLVLQDLAGNTSPANKTDPVNLRFDNVPPGRAELPRTEGWLNVDTFAQPVGMAAGALRPVSGILGYSVTRNTREPDGTVDIGGPTYRLPALPEGVTVVKARAISGSGVPSAAVASTELRVDRTAPVARAVDPPDAASWSRSPVEVRLAGTDQAHLSGMRSMAYRLDGGAERSVPGASASATFADDGVHSLTFAAVDAAGNRSPERAVGFRIDRTAPELVVFEAADPADPRRLVVAASDRTSGVSGATVEMRRFQSNERWTELPVVRDGDRFVTRIDDESLDLGVYELRARVSDRAGNESAGDRRRDGSPAVVDTAALRGGSRMTAALVTPDKTKTKTVCPKRRPGRKRKCRKRKVTVPGGALVPSLALPFATGAEARGALEADDGSPLAGAEVEVDVRPAAAGAEFERAGAVRTDARGSFAYTLPAGSSREVRFRYRGSGRHRPSEATVSARVAAAATIAVGPRRVRNGRSVRFRGKLRSLPVPPAGKLLDLQAHFRGKWRTFATPRASAKGKWSYRYRFGATRGTVPYRFRVVIRPESAYPYDLGYSKTVRVVVRGR